MKTILVPTDFSPCADNAFQFAINICGNIDARIMMLHAYQVPVVQGSVPGDIVVDTMDDIEKEALAQLAKYQEKGASLGQAKFGKPIAVDVQAQAGFTSQEIVNKAEELKPYMIVMGTKGATGAREVLLGSTASNVIKKSHLPVFVVPDGAESQNVSHIVYATDFEEIDRLWIKELLEFARPFRAKVTCLHISTDNAVYEDVLINDLKDRMWLESETDELSFAMIEGQDVTESLTRYAEKSGADVIAMMSHHRSFIEKIFTKSFTRKMTLHSHIPLLIFPEK